MPEVFGFDARDAKRIGAAVRKAEGTKLGRTGEKNLPAPLTVLGEITGGSNPYDWIQQRLRSDGTTENMPGGVTGTAATPLAEAYESGGATGIAVGSIVHLTRHVLDGAPPRVIWVFSAAATLPVGEFQHQSYYMVSQNQAGWSFVRAHGLPA